MSTQDLAAELKKLTDGSRSEHNHYRRTIWKSTRGCNFARECGVEKLVSLVACQKKIPFIKCDSNIVHYKEVTLYGANGSSPAQNQQALNMIASGEVKVSDLITHRVKLENVQSAIDAVLRGQAIKVVINP